MSDTPNLALPLIAAGQSQKHVTHNDALVRLDAIVQLAVIDRDLNAPPGSPAEGDCYLAAGSPTGAWAGHAGKIFFYTASGWARVDPGVGWLAYVIDEALTVSYDGAAWNIASGGVTELNSLDDVDPSGIADGDMLIWDAGSSTWLPVPAAIAQLVDVDLTGLADGDTLVWDAGGSEWRPGAAGAGTFLALTDTPADFTGDARKTLRVNAGETAVEFVIGIEINAQTGTSYTGVLIDSGKLVTMDNAASNSFQIPLNASVAYAAGEWMAIKRKGAGATTILAPSGGTLNGVTNGSCAIAAQWNTVVVTKLGTDAWTIDGAHGVVT